jgi:hypothetical protein
MKTRLILTALFSFFVGITGARSQNLLANGDFEIYSALPSGHGQFYLASGWGNVNNNLTFGFPYASPDYHHLQGSVPPGQGSIIPFSGAGQMGFATYSPGSPDFREYITAQLVSPLIIGQSYQISFYLTNGYGGGSLHFTNNVGVHFSKTPLTQITHEPIAVNPQLEFASVISNINQWQQYVFNFNPTDAFSYITIGNFRNDANTTITSNSSNSFGAYYFIDKIEVAPSSATGLNDQTAANAITVYPNPSNGRFSLQVNNPANNIFYSGKVTIYNSSGAMVYRGLITVNKQEIDLTAYPIGIYYYQIENEKKIIKQGKLTVK